MMKTTKIFLLTFAATLFIIQACTIQKRVHRPGYHIAWHKSEKSEGQNALDKTSRKSNEAPIPEYFAVHEKQADETEVKGAPQLQEKCLTTNQASQSMLAPKNDECDIIILKNGDEILAKVLEIGTSEIKYLRCDNLTGPNYTIRKFEVFMIKHPNGTKTVVNAKTDEAEEEDEDLSDTDYIRTVSSDDKSFVLAVGLWFFLGLIGIHRFYLGHIGIGILYLLTAGCCGIGWLIDGILFLTGDLKPKRGEYLDD